MKLRLNRNVIYLIVGLIVFSFFALWIPTKSKDLLVFTEEKAIQVAVVYLTKKEITVDLKKADVVFNNGQWSVFFLVNPSIRPAGILVRINPITGNSKVIPLE